MKFIKLNYHTINIDQIVYYKLNEDKITIKLNAYEGAYHFHCNNKDKAKQIFENLEKIIKPIDIENLL